MGSHGGEIWFSELVRRLLKRGDFKSLHDLRAQIEAFIKYFNTTLAHPYRWTYTGGYSRLPDLTDASDLPATGHLASGAGLGSVGLGDRIRFSTPDAGSWSTVSGGPSQPPCT